MKHIHTFESFLNEAASEDAAVIHAMTDCGQDAAQDFIDETGIDSKKLIDHLKKTGNGQDKYHVRDMIAGVGLGSNKGFRDRFIKDFK